VLLTVWVNTVETLAWWRVTRKTGSGRRRGADDVPPHRDVVDDGQQVAGEDVDRAARTRMTTKMMKTRVRL
jgi:hypothetical protein